VTLTVREVLWRLR